MKPFKLEQSVGSKCCLLARIIRQTNNPVVVVLQQHKTYKVSLSTNSRTTITTKMMNRTAIPGTPTTTRTSLRKHSNQRLDPQRNSFSSVGSSSVSSTNRPRSISISASSPLSESPAATAAAADSFLSPALFAPNLLHASKQSSTPRKPW